MNSIRPEFLHFSHGIDRVLRFEPSHVELPPAGGLLPDEADPRPQLDMLLSAQTINGWATAQQLPQLVSAEVLTPARFAQVLKGMMSGLRHAADMQPRAARVFGEAASLLADEVAMRELLHMYCNVVVKA